MATWVGGTIPFITMMQKNILKHNFSAGTGGPGNNNAHGPDEKLHIPSSKRLIKKHLQLLQHYLNKILEIANS